MADVLALQGWQGEGGTADILSREEPNEAKVKPRLPPWRLGQR